MLSESQGVDATLEYASDSQQGSEIVAGDCNLKMVIAVRLSKGSQMVNSYQNNTVRPDFLKSVSMLGAKQRNHMSNSYTTQPPSLGELVNVPIALGLFSSSCGPNSKYGMVGEEVNGIILIYHGSVSEGKFIWVIGKSLGASCIVLEEFIVERSVEME
ncbi:hypothetical protein VNO78_22765 [Psophocarpus tetragonolobus]|uniref:Uncharacterized protein n=1 Tax=Psophocarpus tetragonolobus TaxID=3891 RepID=A0AAN9S2V5_PSOTE